MSATAEKPQALPGRIVSAIEGGIGWIVLDNPSKLNAISIAMWQEMSDALAGFAADPAVRCVVLRGEGDRAFCVGADVAEKEKNAAENASKSNAEQNAVAFAAMKRLTNFEKPTIAMIRGYCLGGGLALALCCDMRFSETVSRFGIPAARLGLAYNYNGLTKLVALVGPSTAKRIMFTADRFPAEQAQRFGLIDEALPAEELAGFVSDISGRIAANAPLTIASAKFNINQALLDAADRDQEGILHRENTALSSEDFIEGRRAFLEKRPPVFKAR
jgi:enoyl-CoA hydratase